MGTREERWKERMFGTNGKFKGTIVSMNDNAHPKVQQPHSVPFKITRQSLEMSTTASVGSGGGGTGSRMSGWAAEIPEFCRSSELEHWSSEPDAEVLDCLARLGTEGHACLRCRRAQILAAVTQYSQDIACSGCVPKIKKTLTEEERLGRQGLMGALFHEILEDDVSSNTNDVLNSNASGSSVGSLGGVMEIRDSFEEDREIAQLFAKYNSRTYFSRNKGSKGRHRCVLHSTTTRFEEGWQSVWKSMPLEIKKGICRLDTHELSNYLTEHLKDLYFCRDCRGNVLKALHLLTGFDFKEDLASDEEFNETYFAPFQLRSYDDLYDEGPLCDRNGGSDIDNDALTKTDSLGELDDVDSTSFPVNMDEYSIVEKTASAVQDVQENGRESPHECDCEEHSNGNHLRHYDRNHHENHQHDHHQNPEHHDRHDYHHHHRHHHHHHHHRHDEEMRRELKDDDGRHGHGEDNERFDERNEDATSYGYSNQATYLMTDLDKVASLIEGAEEADRRDEESRRNGGSSDRHAPTLQDGQLELLHCIGKLLRRRIRDTWTDVVEKARTDEILVWLTLSSMRTNLQSALQSQTEGTLNDLLEEEDREKEKKERKKKKKKSKKKRKAAEKEAVPAGPSIPTEEVQWKDFESKPSDPAPANWDQASEARLLAQLSEMSSDPSNPRSSLFEQLDDGAADVSSSLSEVGEENLADDTGEGLTEEEIREAQLQLEQMMANSSRAELRANLREKFNNLCFKH